MVHGYLYSYVYIAIMNIYMQVHVLCIYVYNIYIYIYICTYINIYIYIYIHNNYVINCTFTGYQPPSFAPCSRRDTKIWSCLCHMDVST